MAAAIDNPNRRKLLSPNTWTAAGLHLATVRTASMPGPVAELRVARRAMACDFSVTFPGGADTAIEAGCAALDEIERLEEKLSVYRDDSDLSRLNRSAAGSPIRVDAELYHILRTAARLAIESGGAFDAAAGALVKAWGFFRGPKRVPSADELAAALAATGSHHAAFNDDQRTVAFDRPGVEFNLGSIGKGFAIDRALHCMQSRFAIRCALLQGGQSSLRAIGTQPGGTKGWLVAIGDPCCAGKTLARVRLHHRALGTSGAANQFFVHQGRRYGHVLDPRRGWPAAGLLCASAVARTAAEADALSTAFFVLGIDETRRYCQRHSGAGAVLVAPPEEAGGTPRVVLVGAVDAEVTI